MDDRIIGSLLIIFGLSLAGLGGTMSDAFLAIYYILGFLIAFVGVGFFLKYKKTLQSDE